MSEVKHFQSRLLEIQARTQDTPIKLVSEEDQRSAEDRYAAKLRQMQAEHDAAGSTPPSGEKVVSDLLARCLIWADVIQQK